MLLHRCITSLYMHLVMGEQCCDLCNMMAPIIAMENVNVGEYSRENIPLLKGMVEPEIKVHMNVKFLTEVVQGLKEKVTFRLKDCVNPMFLSSDKGFSACIMPIRTAE